MLKTIIFKIGKKMIMRQMLMWLNWSVVTINTMRFQINIDLT